MNRLAGIITAAIGLLIALLGALKVVPGQTQTGVFVILLGALIIGLSFVSKPPTDETPKMSTLETLHAIFHSPGEVFQNLRRHPRWLVAMIIMTIVSSIYVNLFINRLTSERVVNYSIDKTLEMPMLNDEARKQIESGRVKAIEDNKNPVNRAGAVVTGFIGQVFFYAFIAALFLLFVMALGGKINYWQAFSSAVYASFPVTILRYVLSSIILFVKDPTDIHPIMGQGSLVQDSLNFLITPAQSPVLYSFLSAFSLLGLYWIFMNATGLKNAGERVSPTAAWSATLGLWLIGVVLGVVAALLFPSFIS